MEKIFGYTKEQLRKQLKTDYDVDPEYKMKPIKPGETFEPCIRGTQKILDDPKEREMMKRIIRGEKRIKTD